MPSRSKLSTISPFRIRAIGAMPRRHAIALAMPLVCASFAWAPPGLVAQAHAQQAVAQRHFDIPAGPLNAALNRFAEDAGVFLTGAGELTQGKMTRGVKGLLTTEAALEALLTETGVEAVRNNPKQYVLRPATPVQGGALPAVMVVGVDGDKSLPAPYAGGQVATGGRLGVLGNKNIMDTPFNVTSYTSQTIVDQQARTIVEILENDPSVLTTTSRLNGMDQFNVRGYSVNNSGSSFNGLYGVGPYYRGSLMGIERVEVFKGASALINGMSPNGSIGGNINLVPKRATDAPLTQFTATYQSDSLLGGHLDFGRRFGDEDRWGIRLNAGYKDGRTSYDSQSQRLGEATLGLDYRGRDVRFSLDAGYLNNKLDGVEGTLSLSAANVLPGAPRASTNYFQHWSTWTTDATYGAVRGEWDINDNLTAYLNAGGRSASEEMLFSSGSNLQANGNFTESPTAQIGKWASSTAEVGVRAHFNTGPVKHEVVLAASTFKEELKFGFAAGAAIASNIYRPNLVANPGLIIPNAAKTSDTILNGVALADTLSFADDRVLLTLGARQQQVKKDNYNALTGAVTTRYDQAALTPALGLVVKPARGVSLYGNYIEALTQGPTAPLTAANAGQVFAPYKSTQYEVGAKVDFGGFATTLSYFELNQPGAVTDPVSKIYSLDGEQQNKGVELNTFGQVSRGVRLLGGIMLLDAKLAKTANGTNDGRTAINSPHATVRLGAEWDTPFLPGLTASARVLHTSAQYIDNANAGQIPSWTRFDLGARYKMNLGSVPTTIRVNIENLFNRDYWLSGNLYRGAPRTFLASATFDF